MNELKPCPFCGEPNDLLVRPTVYDGPEPVTYVVECFSCGGFITPGFSSAQATIEYWNKRKKKKKK